MNQDIALLLIDCADRTKTTTTTTTTNHQTSATTIIGEEQSLDRALHYIKPF